MVYKISLDTRLGMTTILRRSYRPLNRLEVMSIGKSIFGEKIKFSDAGRIVKDIYPDLPSAAVALRLLNTGDARKGNTWDVLNLCKKNRHIWSVPELISDENKREHFRMSLVKSFPRKGEIIRSEPYLARALTLKDLETALPQSDFSGRGGSFYSGIAESDIDIAYEVGTSVQFSGAYEKILRGLWTTDVGQVIFRYGNRSLAAQIIMNRLSFDGTNILSLPINDFVLKLQELIARFKQKEFRVAMAAEDTDVFIRELAATVVYDYNGNAFSDSEIKRGAEVIRRYYESQKHDEWEKKLRSEDPISAEEAISWLKKIPLMVYLDQGELRDILSKINQTARMVAQQQEINLLKKMQSEDFLFNCKRIIQAKIIEAKDLIKFCQGKKG